MEEMLINERFKSPNKEFEKVYAIFDKRDYFNNKGLAKTQIGNFKRALEKNDKGAQKLLDAHKGNMDSAISYIEEFISDGNKRKSFESFQEFSSMVNALEMSTKPNLKQKPAEFIKRRIHNNSQKYTIALYSAIRKQKFNNYKDVHKDVDELVSKNESVNENDSYSIRDDKGRPFLLIVGEQPKDSKGKSQYKKDGFYISPQKGFKGLITAYFKDEKTLKKNIDKKYHKQLGESVNEAKDNLYLQLHKKYAKQIKGLKAKKIKKLSDLVWVQRRSMSDRGDYFDMDSKKKKELSAEYRIERNLLKKYMARDYSVMLPKGTEKLPESTHEEVPQGYNPVVEDKSEITKLVKKVNKSETKFYDVLSVMEKKYGKNKYRIWLEKSLKDFGVNPKHYDYRTNAGAEEKLFQLGK
jgi:hypothetical protein